MTCHEFNILVDDFIDSRLGAEHKDDFHHHLTSCYICQDLLRKMQEFKRRVDNLPVSYEPPRGMLERITADIEALANRGGKGTPAPVEETVQAKTFIAGSGAQRRRKNVNTSEADVFRSASGVNKISPWYLWGAIVLLLGLFAAWFFLLRK